MGLRLQQQTVGFFWQKFECPFLAVLTLVCDAYKILLENYFSTSTGTIFGRTGRS
jgi:hypothetical protein